jgi:hypothetical protein
MAAWVALCDSMTNMSWKIGVVMYALVELAVLSLEGP